MVRLVLEVEAMRDMEMRPFKTCLDCKFREKCGIWRNLRLEGVTEYEEMPIKCPFKQKGVKSRG